QGHVVPLLLSTWVAPSLPRCLRISVAVKTYNNNSNSYKEKHLTGNYLTVSEGWPIIFMAENMATAIMAL
ncbi:hypothetical protein ACQP3C_26060, partial [Escherichia coli]